MKRHCKLIGSLLPPQRAFADGKYRKCMSSESCDDEWVFDTVKPSTVAPEYKTQRRRKPSRIPSSSAENENADDLGRVMEKLELNAAPLNIDSPSPVKRKPVPGGENQTPRRTSSAATAIRRSSATSGNSSAAAEQEISTMRRNSAPKQPLALDMSFGNSTSTVRQFRRVSQIHSPLEEEPPQAQEKSMVKDVAVDAKSARLSRASTVVGDCQRDEKENQAKPEGVPRPPPPTLHSETPSSPSKLGLLGNRAYKRTIAPALQDVVALVSQKTNASPTPKLQSQLSVVTRFESAWNEFNAIDPESELLLLKAILDRIQGEKKLAMTLGLVHKQPMTPAPGDITPRRHHATGPSDVFSDDASSILMASAVTARTSFTPSVCTEDDTSNTQYNTPSPTKKPTSSTQMPMAPPKTPSKSPSKPRHAQTPNTRDHTAIDKSSSSPSKDGSPSKQRRNNRAATPASHSASPTKLILAQNNPHLQQHQRHQSAIAPASPPAPAPLSPRKVRNNEAGIRPNAPLSDKPDIRVVEREVPPSPPKPTKTPSQERQGGGAATKLASGAEAACSPSKALRASMQDQRVAGDLEDGGVRLERRLGLEGRSSMEEAMREKFPGQAVPGLEHVKALGDVLYGKWAEGLRERWAVT